MKRLLLAAVAAAVACAPPPLPPAPLIKASERLAIVERLAAVPGATPDTFGRAAMLSWIMEGDRDRALKWADRALALDPAEPQSLFVRMTIARELLDDAGANDAALQLIERAPASPWTELAAARLFEFAQTSPAIDKAIVDTISTMRAHMPAGRTAVRGREALLAVLDGRAFDESANRIRHELGMPTTLTVVGPLEKLRLRDLDVASPFDNAAFSLQKQYESPLGPVAPRTFPTPGGLLSLDSDPWRADVYEVLAKVDVETAGAHLVSLRGAGTMTLFVDGERVLDRRTYPIRAPERTWGGVMLEKGAHLVRVRFSRTEGSWLALALARVDGLPASLTWTALAPGDSVKAAGAARLDTPPGAREAFLQARSDDPEDPIAAYAAVQAIALDDRELALEAVDTVVALAGESVAPRLLRIDLVANDPDVPKSNGAALVSKDLDAVLARDGAWRRALNLRYEQLRNEKRWDDASARFETLAAMKPPDVAALELSRARLLNERGDVAGARKALDAALAADPERCNVLEMRTDFARRDDEVNIVHKLMPRMEHCPGGLGALVSHLRSEGSLDEAITFSRRMVARSPAGVDARRSLSELLLASGDPAAARAAIEPLVTLWPWRSETFERLADLAELDGDTKAAAGWRSKAAAIGSGDAGLVRASLLDDGRDIASWATRDGLATIAAFKASGFSTSAPAIQVLDFGAVEIQPDGASHERVHSIVQVLDKKGIDRYGEVQIPSDAQTIVVRTVKADGTLLEPESISGKDSISMPNLEPGDFVEYAFVRTTGPRAAALPGFQGGQFFFEGGDTPFFESTYLVRVPAAVGLDVDSANIAAVATPVRDGDWLTFSHTERQRQPYLREPLAPGDGEVVPWVEVGKGATQVDAMRQHSDWVVLRARPSGEVRQLVRGLNGLPEVDRIAGAIQRIRDQVKGDADSNDFSDSAGTILARGRGNRNVVLQAALTALGVKSRICLARPFGANPHPFRFPKPELQSYAILRIEPASGGPTWMDFSQRLAPVGLVPVSMSDTDAWVLAPPGEDVTQLRLPIVESSQDRTDFTFELRLGANGVLDGAATTTAHGFDAATMRRWFEQTSVVERRRQRERELQGAFRGLALVDDVVEESKDAQEPLVRRTTVRVERFGARADGSIVAPGSFAPLQLGVRYLSRSERRTPLLIGAAEFQHTTATLQLPAGWSADVPPPAEITSDFGSFRAAWTKVGGQLALEETYQLGRARVTPDRYGAFKSFVQAVDAAQGRDVPIRKASEAAASR